MNQHVLAAIVFTDIVDFSRAMGSDEEFTMELLRKNRKIHKSTLKKYHGKWHKEIGDGTLSSFSTISDAVYFAGEVMQKCGNEEITLRIGIHQGEILKDNGDIFGDVINITSRIESCAEPGTIYVSQTVYDNVKNKPAISANHMGERTLKNISVPVRIYDLYVNEIYRDQKSSPPSYHKIAVAASLTLCLLSFCSTTLINNVLLGFITI